MKREPPEAPKPQRVLLPRIELRRDRSGRIKVRQSNKPGITSTNELLDSLPHHHDLAVVEFHGVDQDGWYKEPLFDESLLRHYPSTFQFRGQNWHLIGGTINDAGRGELLACPNKQVLHQIVPAWESLDGLQRVKALSRLMQPSVTGSPFQLRLLVVDDPLHDGDGILGPSGTCAFRSAFHHCEASVFKCVSHALKVVFRRHNPRWDHLPKDVVCQHGDLFHRGKPIDGILYRENIKLGKEDYPDGGVIDLTEEDIRLHSTEGSTNFHRAGLSRQLLQYLPADLAASMLMNSDIPLAANQWTKAITGDVDALKYLLHHFKDENADDHEIRNQLVRHLEAGCQDITIPYLRQRVIPLLAGVFRNRIRKGRCLGAYLYVAPSVRLKPFELCVPTRMLSHEERARIRAGHAMEVLATRYPITGHQSINRMRIVAMHDDAAVYTNPEVWIRNFQGDFDGDCITILRADPGDWSNSEPFIPPSSPSPKPMTTPQALSQAGRSKRDVALGESVIADYIHRCWEEYGKLDPEELNELGCRVICSAVDSAKHGTVEWGISADDFARDFLPDRFRHQHSLLASKSMPETDSIEGDLRTRLSMLKNGEFTNRRSGWELLLALLHDWTKGTEVLPRGDHQSIYRQVLSLHAALPAPCERTFELVRLARRRWASAVDHWKRTDDDSGMQTFTERFQAWMARADETLVAKVMLELGRQLLGPKKKGNASLFLSQVPTELLTGVYAKRNS